MNDYTFAAPVAETVMSSARPLHFDAEKCTGCLSCVNICQVDILLPPPAGQKLPVVAYPGECYYCGACVMTCPSDALRLRHPLMNQAKFVEIPEDEH